jgi:hypothetical protein
MTRKKGRMATEKFDNALKGVARGVVESWSGGVMEWWSHGVLESWSIGEYWSGGVAEEWVFEGYGYQAKE